MILIVIATLHVVPGFMLVLLLGLFSTRYIMVLGSMFKPGYILLEAIINIFGYLVDFLFLAICAIWLRDFRRRKDVARVLKKPFEIHLSESVALMYRLYYTLVLFVLRTSNMIPSLALFYSGMYFIWIIALIVINYETNVTYWIDSNESLLVLYVSLQVVMVVPCTILPGRMARADVIAKENSLVQKQSYVRFVSHEIRSPLSVVSAGLELVEREIKVIAKKYQLVELKYLLELTQDMSEASETAMDFVNDLLHYESVEAGRFTIEASQIKPSALIKPTNLRIIAKRNNLNLVMISPSEVTEGCFVMADVHRIEQVLRNLVSNACKFTPAGGTITIETSITKHVATNVATTLWSFPLPPLAEYGGSLRVKVSDNGAGISNENKSRLFQQFVQFNKNELQGGGGSGLGLWIARTIVDLHYGELAFESEGVGLGTSFYFDIPLFIGSLATKSMATARVHPEVVESISASFPEANAHVRNIPPYSLQYEEPGTVDIESGSSEAEDFFSSNNLAISFLIVDDLAMNRKFLRKMLESEESLKGCSIREADDGTSAIEAVLEQNFLQIEAAYLWILS
jgi:signal transduction histidine kinase